MPEAKRDSLAWYVMVAGVFLVLDKDIKYGRLRHVELTPVLRYPL
jgi:hypothetical protein